MEINNVALAAIMSEWFTLPSNGHNEGETNTDSSSSSSSSSYPLWTDETITAYLQPELNSRKSDIRDTLHEALEKVSFYSLSHVIFPSTILLLHLFFSFFILRNVLG